MRKTVPKFSAASSPQNGTVGSGENFNLITIGDSIIAGVGATNLINALVGQTAEKLSHSLDCKITWDDIGSISAVSRQVIDRLIPQLPDSDIRKVWNENSASVKMPGGESLKEVQDRAKKTLERIYNRLKGNVKSKNQR